MHNALPLARTPAAALCRHAVWALVLIAAPALAQPAETEPWTFTALYSHSGLSGGRSDWNELQSELLYRLSPQLILGARLDVRSREQGTDTLYSTLFSYQLNPELELHGSLRMAPNANFSAAQTYNAGLAWRYAPRTALLLDVERLNFTEGSITQLKPGLTYWFTDQTHLTGRVTYGRAFDSTRFDAVSLRLNIGLPEGRKWVLGIAHGTDPEKDPALPGVILTNANTYSAYYHTPLDPLLDLIVGVEYEDRRDIYRRTTLTLGFVRRF